MSKELDSMFIKHILQDTRYKDKSVNEMMMMRANMINSGNATKYELACLQYWLMVADKRFDKPQTFGGN